MKGTAPLLAVKDVLPQYESNMRGREERRKGVAGRGPAFAAHPRCHEKTKRSNNNTSFIYLTALAKVKTLSRGLDWFRGDLCLMMGAPIFLPIYIVALIPKGMS